MAKYEVEFILQVVSQNKSFHFTKSETLSFPPNKDYKVSIGAFVMPISEITFYLDPGAPWREAFAVVLEPLKVMEDDEVIKSTFLSMGWKLWGDEPKKRWLEK